MSVLSLFAGVGGFDIGLERAGFRTTAFSEIDQFKQSILRKHWPETPIYGDVRELTARTLAADGICPTVITGGFPCQDISIAGRGAGITGSRSGLWFEFARLIGEIRPRFAIIENSPKLRTRGLDQLLWSLDALGFNAEWDCITAKHVGAPHRRDRLWILAYRQEDAFCSDTYRQRLHQAGLHLRGEVELFNEQVSHPGPLAWWSAEPRGRMTAHRQRMLRHELRKFTSEFLLHEFAQGIAARQRRDGETRLDPKGKSPVPKGCSQ